MGLDVVSPGIPTRKQTTAVAKASERASRENSSDDETNPDRTVLPPLAGARPPSSPTTGRPPSSSRRNQKPTTREHSRGTNPPPRPPTANNGRAPTLLPPLNPAATNNWSARVKLITYEATFNSTFPCKLTPLQLAAVLKPFWADLLANQLKPVRRHLGELHLKKLDFNAPSVRFAANADATPLHLCAQHGLLAMAKMLVGEFALAATLRNKVGSTPLHVACKFGRRELVSWLVDELGVPLDVPDAQGRLALDVAPFDTVESCVLAPLQRRLAELRDREAELEAQNGEALQRLDAAELTFRRNCMVLSDTESRAQELAAEIKEVDALAHQWQAQWQARSAVLEELAARYDSQRQQLVDEEQRAQTLYDQEVKAVQEDHEHAQHELDELQALVDTTQRELDRRRQLLVDQLGVFDASLREFGGSKDVQQWALSTLLAIAYDESGDTSGAVDRKELLLREEPVAVVRHVLATFPTDHELQYEALELLVAVLRLHGSPTKESSNAFVTAVVDSDLLLQLGDVLARWYTPTEGTTLARITEKTLEALYLCLGLRRNVQRLLAFCQRKNLQILGLSVISQVTSLLNIPSREEDKFVRRFAARVLLTQVTYGVKKVILRAGAVRIIFDALRRISTDPMKSDGDSNETEVEAAQYLLATVALLISSYGNSDGDTVRDYRGKCREPVRLEDVTTDTESIDTSVVIDHVRVCVLAHGHHVSTVSTILWSFRLLTNLSQHGGETALRVRQELMCEKVSLDSDDDPFFVILQGTEHVLSLIGEGGASVLCVQAVLAGLELLRLVWIERFDHEGRVLPTRVDVVNLVPDLTCRLLRCLLVDSFVNAASVLLDVASSLTALVSIAQNPRNATILANSTIEDDILKPILQWTLRYLDETGAAYREPNLVALLLRGLSVFLLISQARRLARSELLHNVSDSEVAGFYRSLHGQSHTIGICAVLKIFEIADTTETNEVTPHEWTALRTVCTQIRSLTHCSC